MKPSTTSRKPFWLVLLIIISLLGGWSLYWFIAKNHLQQQLAENKNKIHSTGWRVDWEQATITGYPFQLRTTFTNVQADNTEATHAKTAITRCQAPGVTAIMQPWNVHHMIGTWQEALICTHVAGHTQLTMPRGRASLVLSAQHATPRLSFEIEGAQFKLHDQEITSAKTVLHLRPTANVKTPGVDAVITMTELSAPAMAATGFDVLETASLAITYSQTPTKAADTTPSTPPSLADPTHHIALKSFLISDGTSQLEASGIITVSPIGLADGKLTTSITRFTALKEKLARRFPDEMAGIDGLLTVVEAVLRDKNSPDNRISTDITIKDSAVSVAGFKLMQLPQLN